jgi:peptidoglycan/LPS O-acetylase OafA/YrhL
MVQVSMVLLTVLTALASLGVILLFGFGVCAVISGRITLCADCLKGPSARIAGLIMSAALPLLIVAVALFGGPRGVNWFSGERFLVPFVAVALVLAGVVGTFCFKQSRVER